MNNWNKSTKISFDKYLEYAHKSNKKDLIVIQKAPNCDYCYFCHESVGGGYRVLIKKIDPLTQELNIVEVLACYGCYPKLLIKKK